MHFFPQLTTVSVVALNTGVKIKQIKQSYMVTLLFSVHTITEAKQYAGLGRAEPGLKQGRWIYQPGHLTWRDLVYAPTLPKRG